MKKYYLILILLIGHVTLTFSQGTIAIEADNLGGCVVSNSYHAYMKIKITKIPNGDTVMGKIGSGEAKEIPMGEIDLTNVTTRSILSIGSEKKFTLNIYLKNSSEKICKINFDIKEAPQSTPVDILELYLKEVIFPSIRLEYKPYEVASKGDTTYLFLDENLKPLRKTIWPDCVDKLSYFKIFVIFNSKQTDITKAEFFLRKKKSEQSRIASGNGNLEINAQSETTKKPYEDWKFLASNTKGPYSTGVDFQVVLYKDQSQTYLRENSFAIDACDQPYHVSILGGYYYSGLNDPSNITVEKIPSDPGNYSLFGDNTKNQRAITIMAVFYPRPRYPDYEHKSLSFMQKWGIAFGTKLTQNLFNDLLLGLNYEVSKGLSFTSGVHYGSHAVIRGYENFEFGKTRYGGDDPTTVPTFSNSQLSQQWDFGWFAGVTIDLRVVGAIFNNRGKLSNEE